MFDEGFNWEGAKEAGHAKEAHASIGANIYPNIHVMWWQPDGLFLEGGAQQTSYKARFVTDELPLFNIGTILTINGQAYRCTHPPRMIGRGYWSEADMTFENRVYPKRAMRLADGEVIIPNPIPANDLGMLNRIAHVLLPAFAVVRNVDGVRVDIADNTVEAHAVPVLGINIAAAAANATVLVQNKGPLTNPLWAWVPNQPIFLGVAGALTQTPPTAASGALFSQRIAFAQSPTNVFIEIEPPLYF